jgi:hypothetical protein
LKKSPSRGDKFGRSFGVVRGTRRGVGGSAREAARILGAALSGGLDAKRGRPHSRLFSQRGLKLRSQGVVAFLGPAAETPLREALTKAKSLEIRRRLVGVLEGQEAEHRHLSNAVEVLEIIGTPAVRGLLLNLGKGASGSPRLTREARVAIDRLKKLP